TWCSVGLQTPVLRTTSPLPRRCWLPPSSGRVWATLAHGPELGSRRAGVAKAVEEQLGLLLQRAVGILRTDRAAAVAFAERLVVERLLSGTDVAKVLSEPVAKAASRRKARTSSIQDLDQRDDRLPT